MMSYSLCSGVSGVEGLPGLHVDSWHAAAQQRVRPSGAPVPAAGWITTLPGAAGGAVPQTYVTLLNTWDPCGGHLRLSWALSDSRSSADDWEIRAQFFIGCYECCWVLKPITHQCCCKPSIDQSGEGTLLTAVNFDLQLQGCLFTLKQLMSPVNTPETWERSPARALWYHLDFILTGCQWFLEQKI